MKTFETERHSMPKGATHYIDETCVHRFSWGKYVGDDLHLRLFGDTEWTCVENKFFSGVIVEIKKPRTKTEFVQQGFHKCHEAMFKHEMEEELYISSHNGFIVASMSNIIDNWRTELYRKVETEIDERQEFIDTAIELLNKNSHDNEANHYKEWFGAMFDSGKFKLVE